MDCHIRGRRARARRPLVALGLALAARLVHPPAARACDICSVYTATEQRESRTGFRVGIATQFTSFGTLRDGGQEVANPDGQYLDSSVTQNFFGYQVTPRVGV